MSPLLRHGLETVFWSAVAGVAYTYVFYPLLLFIVSSAAELRRGWARMRHAAGENDAPDDAALPRVSVVVAAHNERDEMPWLLQALRRLQYHGALEVVIVSDGSSDGTDAWLQSQHEPWLHAVCLPRQQGKAAALNAGVAQARGEVLLLLDASTRPQPDTLLRMMPHFTTPDIGVVCGGLRFHHGPGSEHTEGAYWSFECLLRLMEGRIGATLTASGALYAVRKCCFPKLARTAWIEDFLVPMHARRMGFRVAYEPDAWAWETAAPSVGGEFRRRARLAVGSFRALRTLLHTPLDAATRWAFVSHKLLRWCVPFLLLLALAVSIALAGLPLYRGLLGLQLLAYAVAAAGALGLARRSRLAQAWYFFLAMNAAFLWGFLLFVFDHGESAWQQVR
ncbi:MAG: glycosyltransferase [Terriglobales bacterium]